MPDPDVRANTPATVIPGEAAPVDVSAAIGGGLLPTGALAQTVPRRSAFAATVGVTSGKLTLHGIWLPAGITVASITFVSGTTPLAAGTNQWFALFDSARTKLGVTADDTSVAWAASAAKTLALAAPWFTRYSGLYYLGLLVAAGTPPTFQGLGTSPVGALAPAIAGGSDTGLTTPATCPTTPTLSGNAWLHYAYVS